MATLATAFPQWGLSWTYDRYGNRTNQSQTVGNPPTNSLAISTSTNRITETWAAYDANGNMTNDGLNTLGYDADNRMVSAAGWAYAVNGAGLRVRKCTPNCTSPTSNTIYIFSGTKVIAEYDDGAGVTAPTREYVYLGGRLLAKIESSTTMYFHGDHLSNRILTNSSGNITSQSAHYPFGEQWIPSSPPPNTKWFFTTYERDSESSNDYAIFRSYINRFGRFSSPDLFGGTVYAPQSLNRYSYVTNDPCNMVDPLGLASCNFNFWINYSSDITVNQMNAIEQQIRSIFGQSDDGNGNTITVSFNTAKPADGTVNFLNSSWFSKRGAGGVTLCLFGSCSSSSKVYVDIVANYVQVRNEVANSMDLIAPTDLESALGGVSAHEIGHQLLGPKHSDDPSNLMYKEFGATSLGDTLLTKDQISALFKKCQEFHPPKPASAPLPSGGGGTRDGGGIGTGSVGAGGMGGGGFASIFDYLRLYFNYVFGGEQVTHVLRMKDPRSP